MDSVVDCGIGVYRCLVLPPNFSIYEQLPNHRRHLRRPSKSTWSATGVVTTGHPDVALCWTPIGIRSRWPQKFCSPAPPLQSHLRQSNRDNWPAGAVQVGEVRHIVHQIW
ncbi:unnamed protein product [Urochloa humidicola]